MDSRRKALTSVAWRSAVFSIGDGACRHQGHAELSSDRPNLRVTVVATNDRGTLAALRTAGKLAANLGARIALVKAQVVPFQFPLDKPPVSTDFLQRQLHGLVCEARIEAEEITIQLWLCRNRNESLRKILRAHSLVVIGGRKRWWSRRERTLERYLSRLGHQVVFVDLDARGSSDPRSDSCSDSVFHSVTHMRCGNRNLVAGPFDSHTPRRLLTEILFANHLNVHSFRTSASAEK